MSKALVLQRDLCFVEIIEGETDGLDRQLEESELVDRLKGLDVNVLSFEINAAGCFVVVHGDDIARVAIAARPFNLAVRLSEPCAKLSLRVAGERSHLALLRDVITVFHQKHVALVDIAFVSAALSVIVDEKNVAIALEIETRCPHRARSRGRPCASRRTTNDYRDRRGSTILSHRAVLRDGRRRSRAFVAQRRDPHMRRIGALLRQEAILSRVRMS